MAGVTTVRPEKILDDHSWQGHPRLLAAATHNTFPSTGSSLISSLAVSRSASASIAPCMSRIYGSPRVIIVFGLGQKPAHLQQWTTNVHLASTLTSALVVHVYSNTFLFSSPLATGENTTTTYPYTQPCFFPFFHRQFEHNSPNYRC